MAAKYIKIPDYVKIYRNGHEPCLVNRKYETLFTINSTVLEWLSIIGRKFELRSSVVSKLTALYSECDRVTVCNDFEKLCEELYVQGHLEMSEVPEQVEPAKYYPPLPCEKDYINTLPSATIEITEKCNERCIHCYLPNSRKDKGDSLSLDEIKNIIDQLCELEIIKLTISGGEALLHRNVKEAIEYAAGKGIEIALLSNFTLLSSELLECMKKVGNITAQVSLYGVTEDVHDSITGKKGSCRLTKQAIERLKANGIGVVITTIVMKDNHHDIANVMRYAKALGIKLQLDYIMIAKSDFDRSNLENRMSPEETESFFRTVLANDKEYGLGLLKKYNHTVGSDADGILCDVGINGCCIASNGEVHLCPGWQDLILGNMRNDNLFDIWNNNEILSTFRDEDLSQTLKPCIDCGSRNFCNRCVARNYNESGGDMFKPNEATCEIAHLCKRLYDEYALA